MTQIPARMKRAEHLLQPFIDERRAAFAAGLDSRESASDLLSLAILDVDRNPYQASNEAITQQILALEFGVISTTTAVCDYHYT
jgi:cytochrome P450